MIGRIFLIAGILLIITGGAFAQTHSELREEFHQTFPLAADGRVRLANINGDVRISVWDRNELKVEAVKRARTRERLAEAEIKVDVTSDEIRIRTRYPEDSGNYNNPATVDYTLTVPRGVRLSGVELINGSLEIDGVEGNVKASSINGRITARTLKGEAKLSTINGPIEANFDRLVESLVSIESVNGSIALTIPSDASAQVKASTVHGGISNEFGLPVRRGEFVGRDLAGKIGDGVTRIKLGNVNGSIKIRRASDGRQLSPVTNLLPDAKPEGKRHKSTDKDKDEDSED